MALEHLEELGVRPRRHLLDLSVIRLTERVALFMACSEFPVLAAERLAARAEVLPFSTGTGDVELDLMITEIQVRFDISASALTRGAIGGVVTIDSILEAAEDMGLGHGLPDPREAVESIADVHPGIDPARCEALSIGLFFDGTSATLN